MLSSRRTADLDAASSLFYQVKTQTRKDTAKASKERSKMSKRQKQTVELETDRKKDT